MVFNWCRKVRARGFEPSEGKVWRAWKRGESDERGGCGEWANGGGGECDECDGLVIVVSWW